MEEERGKGENVGEGQWPMTIPIPSMVGGGDYFWYRGFGRVPFYLLFLWIGFSAPCPAAFMCLCIQVALAPCGQAPNTSPRQTQWLQWLEVHPICLYVTSIPWCVFYIVKPSVYFRLLGMTGMVLLVSNYNDNVSHGCDFHMCILNGRRHGKEQEGQKEHC